MTLVPGQSPDAAGGGDVNQFPIALAVDTASVYWLTNGTAQGSYMDGTVMKVSKNGGATTTLAAAQNLPYRLAVDTTDVYWTSTQGGTVSKVSISGGAVTSRTRWASPWTRRASTGARALPPEAS